jgi:hypothetical protein
MEKLTYKDFKIGQIVVCVKMNDFYDQHLTIGKKYTIEDVDFHFPNSICIRSDNKKISIFADIEFFSDNKYVRKLKLKKINASKNL